MSYNRSSSRRGSRGGTSTSSSSTYRRRRNSGWSSGSDRREARGNRYNPGSDGQNENPQVNPAIHESGTDVFAGRGSSDSDRKPEERRYSTRDSAGRNAKRNKRLRSSDKQMPSIFNWKIIIGVLIAVGIILAIIFAVNNIETDGMIFSKLGENVKQFSIKLLWLLVISVIEWAIVAFTIFKDTWGLLKAFVFIGIFILVIIASFKNIVAIVILGILTIASVVKFIVSVVKK